MVTSIKAVSHTNALCHYCKYSNAKQKLCNKRTAQKNYIENFVINECRKLLITENISGITREVVALREMLIREIECKQANYMPHIFI